MLFQIFQTSAKGLGIIGAWNNTEQHRRCVMSDGKARATLSKGRQSWCVIFRHPVCLGPDGKQKLRVRRGLGTSEQSEAQVFVDRLNQILDEPALWNLSSREAAAQRFDAKIVGAVLLIPCYRHILIPGLSGKKPSPCPGGTILPMVMRGFCLLEPPEPERRPL